MWVVSFIWLNQTHRSLLGRRRRKALVLRGEWDRIGAG